MHRVIEMVVVAFILLALAGSAGAEVIYQNDFGTQAQQDEFLSTFDVTGSTLLFGGTGVTSSRDITGDGLGSYIVPSALYVYTYCDAAFSAPAGSVYDNTSFSIRVFANKPGYDARAYVYVSYSPDFAEGTYVIAGATGSTETTLTADTTGIAGFENLKTVYVRLQLRNTWTDVSQGKAYVYWIQGQADVNEAPASLPEVIYQNDFGTQAQQDEFLSTFTVTGSSMLFGGTGSASSRDITGDGLGAYIYPSALYVYTYCDAAFSAPAGSVYDNTSFSIRVFANLPSYDARAYLYVSYSPDFAEGTYVRAGVTGSTETTLTVDTTGVAGFENLDTVYVRLQLRNTWTDVSQGKAYVYWIQGQANVNAVPVFSPEGPEINGTTSVSISYADPTADIYYTINTAGYPDVTTGTQYTAPITINPGDTLKAVAVIDGVVVSSVKSVSYIAPVTKIDTKTWTFSRVQVANGGSVYWTSDSPISPAGTSYDYTYTITKIELSMTTLSWTDMTNFFDASYLSGGGTVNGSVPFDVINQTMSGTSGGFGATATVYAYVDSSGYLHVDITNVSLDLLMYNYARVSGTVTANAYARVYSASPVLVALPGSVDVTADAGSTSFAVSNAGGGTMNWSAQVIDGAGWVSITSGASGSNSGTIGVAYAKNISPVATRTATIRITASGATGSPKDVMIIQVVAALVPGDANKDGRVDVGDLGILAANYGRNLASQGVEASQWWGLGDFSGDGVVDVGDLGILAANYGTNTSGADFDADYAAAFESSVSAENEDVGTLCGALGLPLMAGLVLMGLMLVKLEE